MNDMIKKIIDANKADLEQRKLENPPEKIRKQILNLPENPDFVQAFKDFGIIAEIKLASPLVGELAKSDQVLEIASDYRKGGANAISVITEKFFFEGDINFISQVKKETELPVLQKDFIVDPYQIYEARAAGSDALLLIARIISADELKEFVNICIEIKIEPVVEINDEEDLKKALQTKTRAIAVNARDLDRFEVDIKKACELIRVIPKKYLKLGFSGVNSKEEVGLYRDAGASGVLIGTQLMKAKKKKEFLEGLR